MAQMLPGVISRAPWLNDELYEDERQRYLRASAVSELLSNYILGVSENEGIEHVAARVLEQYVASTRLASQLADKLGMTPRSYVEIHSIIASMRSPEHTLQEMLENGRFASERAQERRRLALEQSEQPSAPGEIGPPDVLPDAPSAPAVACAPDADDPEDSPA